MRSRIHRHVEEKAVLRDRLEEIGSLRVHPDATPRYLVIILEKHPVSGYELRHYRREPDDVLTSKVDVDILACPKEGAPSHPKLHAARVPLPAAIPSPPWRAMARGR